MRKRERRRGKHSNESKAKTGRLTVGASEVDETERNDERVEDCPERDETQSVRLAEVKRVEANDSLAKRTTMPNETVWTGDQ